MLPLCSRSRPSAPSSLSEWQCVRGCSDAMRNFLGRSARPCTSPQRACLAQTRACALDARTRVLRNSKSSRQSVLAPLEIGRVRALARGPAASLVLLCVRFWPGLQVIHVGRSSRHGWQTRARPGCRSVLRGLVRSETRSRHLTPFRAGYTTLSTVKVWAAAGAGRCALTCVAITAGRALNTIIDS